ncbi:putative membrane protein [Vibrio phage pVa-21]|nr:putative membrane protein [Vibrio phage pVa-21]
MVKGEQHKLEDYPNKWGCIIPLFAPFYRKDLTLRHVEEDRTLHEGIDYYLGHYYKAASEENKMPIFGSVMIIDQTLSGTIEFVQYRTLGGRYNMLKRVIDVHLNQVDLRDPRNLDWEDVMRYEMAIPSVDAPANIDEAIANDLPTGALDRVRKALERLNEAQKQGYDDVIAALIALTNKIHAHDVDNHEDKRGRHRITAAQLNALHRDDTAVDSLKAYGYVLADLVTLVNLLGENAEDTDNLFRLIGDTLEGRLRFDGSNVIIQNEGGSALINLVNGDLNILSNSNIVLEADASGGNDKITASLRSGDNLLTVHSDAGNDDTAVYNGFYLIHVGNLADFMPPPDYVDTILHVETTETVYLAGRGLSGSPLTGYVFYPVATSTTNGVFRLNHSIYSDSKDMAASGRALYNLNRLASEKVDNTFTINGHRLNQDITITKTDLGLGNVNDTAPENKPASNAFKSAAAAKANAAHSHPNSDFTNIPYADHDTYGMTKLTTTQSSRDDVAATPVMLNDAYQSQLVAESNLSGKMPSLPFDIMQYGGFGYLPLPVLGSYGAAGTGSGVAVGCIEADGRLVLLRNGADHANKGVYYWYGEFKTDGTFSKTVTTTTEYRPNFIEDGDRVSHTHRGSETVFPLSTINGKYYLVLTRSTMDMSKHVGAEIVDLNGCPLGNGCSIFLYKNEVHFHFHYFGNGGCYSRHWKAKISDIEAGRPITLERVGLNGDDWKGNAQNDTETFFFTTLGQANNLDGDKPIIHRLDNGHWSGSNNVRHSTQNSMFYIKDNKLRVQVYGRTYYSRSDGSTGYPLSHSFVLDLDTMQMVSDNADCFPIKLYNNRWEMPAGKSAPAEAWTGANPNNNTPVLVTRDRMFAFRFYGTTYIPRVYEFKSGTDLSVFDYLEAGKSNPVTITAADFEGAYGSVVGAGTKYMGFLPGNKLISDQLDGRDTICTYDLNGSYVEDGTGWGPTSDRRLLPNGDNARLIRVPMNWDTNKNEGFVISSTYPTNNSKIVNETPTSPVSWSSALVADLRTRFRALHPATGGMSLWEDRVMLHAFGDWEKGANTLVCFIQYTYVFWADAAKSSRRVFTATHKCTITMAGAAVASVNIGELISNPNWNNSVVGWGSFESFGMNTCGTTDDGHKVYCLNHSLYVSYVGHSGGRIFQIVLDKDDGSVLYERNRNAHTHVMYASYWHPDIGLIDTVNEYAAQVVSAKKLGRTVAEMSGNTYLSSQIIHATQVASGWVVYFTEAARFYVAGESLELPIQNFDLSKMSEFPNYQNKTFYIYVEVTYDNEGVGTANYKFSLTKTADSETSMYIGYAITGDTQINELKVDRATRLGMIYELEEHIYDRRAHNDITNLDKNSFSLGKVENMGMIHTLTLPTFKEVFNSWERISHFKDSATQPHNPGELSSWTYTEATDTIKCTINSATFVGFVSPAPVGDYVFDTLVGSPDGDNDAVAVILAFIEDAQGIEHTICAVRAQSIEGHMAISGKFDIWYDYHLPSRKLIKTGGGTGANAGGWGGNYSRITAVRKGEKFVVSATRFIKSTKLEDHGKEHIEVVHEFDLQQFTELQQFKSGGRFGYGCMSQPNSTFINILRPDENVGNYYASADTIRILSERQAEAVAFATGTIGGGHTLPIPIGFTAADCHAVVSFNHSSSTSKLTYAKAVLSGLTCNITIRLAGGSVVTNPLGCNARYYLIARKNPEV